MSKKDKIILTIAVLAIVLATASFVRSIWNDSPAQVDNVGVGSLAIENYVPVIKHNEGYYSAYGITTTGNISAAAITATGAFTGTSGTLTSTLIVDKLYEGSGVLATTTPDNITLAASDIQNYSVIEMNPTVGDITVTMPASSTLTTFIPTAGQIGRLFFQNSTTTNGIDITLANGTGVYVNTGSTTKAINYNNYAVYLECMRKSNSDIYCWLNN